MNEIGTREILQTGLKVLGINNEEDLWEADMEVSNKLAKLVLECAYTKWTFAEGVDLEQEVVMIMES